LLPTPAHRTHTHLPSFPTRRSSDLLPKSGIRDFFDIVAKMKDAISLGVGEPDFDTPWHIREAGIYALEKGKTHYTSNLGLIELRDRKSTRLNSSHSQISYAVFCWKK